MSRIQATRTTVLLSFCAGAAAGALGVLYTWSRASRGAPADPHPASGEDLRGKAAGVWQDAKDHVEARIAETRPCPAGAEPVSAQS
jgi:uncharacterized membrane protein